MLFHVQGCTQAAASFPQGHVSVLYNPQHPVQHLARVATQEILVGWINESQWLQDPTFQIMSSWPCFWGPSTWPLVCLSEWGMSHVSCSICPCPCTPACLLTSSQSLLPKATHCSHFCQILCISGTATFLDQGSCCHNKPCRRKMMLSWTLSTHGTSANWEKVRLQCCINKAHISETYVPKWWRGYLWVVRGSLIFILFYFWYFPIGLSRTDLHCLGIINVWLLWRVFLRAGQETRTQYYVP